jgi:flagellar assembly protein FliH
MWPRARRLPEPPEATSFIWGSPGEQAAAPAPHAHDVPVHGVDVDQVAREAYDRGVNEGYANGVAAESERASAALARLLVSLDALAAARGDMIRATEHQMVELALAVARRIVQREVRLDRDLLVSMAHVALQRLEHGVAVTVRFNPEDYTATIASQTARWAGMPVTVVPDSSLPRGEVRVDSAFGRVEAGVEAQLQEVGLALLGAPIAGADAA